MKALRYILLALVILAAVGLLCYYAFIEKNLSSSNIVKCVILIMSAVLAMLRPARKRRPSNLKAAYQKSYAEFIQNAFSDDPKLEKKLYAAIYDYNRNKPSSAIVKLQKLRKQCQRTSDLYAVTVFTALCCDDMGAYAEAIEHYDAAAKMRGSSTLHSNMGLCYQKIGKFKEAEAAYDRAIQLDPNNTYALNNLSVLYFRRGEYEHSLELAKQVLSIDAKMVQALSNAAICSALTGRMDDYTAYYRQAVTNGYDGQRIKDLLKHMDSEQEGKPLTE